MLSHLVYGCWQGNGVFYWEVFICKSSSVRNFGTLSLALENCSGDTCIIHQFETVWTVSKLSEFHNVHPCLQTLQVGLEASSYHNNKNVFHYSNSTAQMQLVNPRLPSGKNLMSFSLTVSSLRLRVPRSHLDVTSQVVSFHPLPVYRSIF